MNAFFDSLISGNNIETLPNATTQENFVSSTADFDGSAGARSLVLIVEDDADMSHLLLYVLKHFYRVETARNGIEGVEKALQEPPDLIICDLAMPKMSGQNLLHELRKHHSLKDVPVVVITANHDVETRAELLRDGAQDYITKPFTHDELLTRVSHHLSVGRTRKSLLQQGSELGSHREKLQAGKNEWFEFQSRVLAQVEDAVNVIDRQHRVIYWNNAAARLYEIEASEALGRPLAEIYSYEWLNAGGRQSVLAEIESKGYWKGECLHRLTKNGREILVEVSISSLRDSGGVSVGFLAVIRDITERKRAEEARFRLEKERDELLSRLQCEIEETRYLRDRLNLQFERMPIGCIVWNEDFRVESWNPAATEIFGYTADEMRGQTALERLVAPEVQPSVNQVWQDFLRGKATAHSINENLTRDGRRIICQWANTPLFDRDGNLSGVLSMAQDITDRVHAEENLRVSEERFRNTFEQAAVGVAHVASDGHFLQVNRKLCEILGYSRQQMLSGMRFQEITHPADLASEVALFDMARQSDGFRANYTLDKRYCHKNGRLVWGSVTASFVRCADVEPYFVTVIEDISERKRAERSQRLLAEATSAFAASLDYEATLRTIARLCVEELAEFCLIDLVGSGVAVEWPEAEEGNVRRVAGGHRDESKKHLIDKLLTYAPRLQEGLPSGEAFATGRTVYLEACSEELLQATTDNATHLQLVQELNVKSCVISPLIARGRVIGLVKLCNSIECSFERRDISLIEELVRRAALALENAHLYGEAQKARREAEAASRAKDEFLAVVSHELRTPLTPILGWVSMLRDNELAGGLNAEMRLHALNAIQHGAEVQSQIIDDLLDVSRIISGNTQLHTHPVRLRGVVEAAIAAVQPVAQKNEIQFWTSFEAELLVEGDQRRLLQVVGNLLSNSLKFTPSGGRIDIQIAAMGGKAQIKISDTGIGIDQTFLPCVFDRFAQADTTASRSYGGLGLGLSIVRHLVELHGGQIEAYSEGKGKGATFIVTLPLLSVASAPKKSESSQKCGSAAVSQDLEHASKKLSGLRVLIVDDEPATRDMLFHAIVNAGAVAKTADSTQKARQILAHWKPDLIISDIGMPGEDGYAFIKFVRALHPHDGGAVPAIALTAYARSQDRESALNAGFQMHLTKPINPADLLEAAIEVLSE